MMAPRASLFAFLVIALAVAFLGLAEARPVPLERRSLLEHEPGHVTSHKDELRAASDKFQTAEAVQDGSEKPVEEAKEVVEEVAEKVEAAKEEAAAEEAAAKAPAPLRREHHTRHHARSEAAARRSLLEHEPGHVTSHKDELRAASDKFQTAEAVQDGSEKPVEEAKEVAEEVAEKVEEAKEEAAAAEAAAKAPAPLHRARHTRHHGDAEKMGREEPPAQSVNQISREEEPPLQSVFADAVKAHLKAATNGGVDKVKGRKGL